MPCGVVNTVYLSLSKNLYPQMHSLLPYPNMPSKYWLEMIGVEIDDPDRPFHISIKNCAVQFFFFKKQVSSWA